MEGGTLLIAVSLAHQEPDHFRVLHEWCAVRVICLEQALPRIFCKERQFKTDCPHDTVDRTLLGVRHRNDAGSGFKLNIMVTPLVVMERVEIEFDGAVCGHGHSPAEHDLAPVPANMRVAVDR